MIKNRKIVAIILMMVIMVCNIPNIYVSAKSNVYINTIEIKDMTDNNDGGIELQYNKKVNNNIVDVELTGRVKNFNNEYGITVFLSLPEDYYENNSEIPSVKVLTVNGVNVADYIVQDKLKKEEIASMGEITHNYPIVKFNIKLDNYENTNLYNTEIKWAEECSVIYKISTKNLLFENYCKVTFFKNESDMQGENKYFYKYLPKGSKLTDFPDAPQFDKYDFIGWKEYGTEDLIDVSDYIINEDKNIIAVWSINIQGRIETSNAIVFNKKKYYKDKAVVVPKDDRWKISSTQDNFNDSVIIYKGSENIGLYLTDGNLISEKIDYYLDGQIDTEVPELKVYYVDEELSSEEEVNNKILCGNVNLKIFIEDIDYIYTEEEKCQGNIVSECKINNEKINVENILKNPTDNSYTLNCNMKQNNNYIIEITVQDKVGHSVTKSYNISTMASAMGMKKNLYKKNGLLYEIYDEQYEKSNYISYADNGQFKLVLIPSSYNGIKNKDWTYGYKIDNGKNITFDKDSFMKNGKLEISLNNLNDGTHIITVFAEPDKKKYGYVKTQKFVYTINVDNTPPDFNSFVRILDGEKEKEENNTDMNFVNADTIEVELNVSDNLSGIKDVLYSMEGYENMTSVRKNKNGKYVINIKPKEDDVTDEELYIILTDNQNNSINVEEKIKIRVDREKPDVKNIFKNITGYTNNDIIITADITDNKGSGVNKVEWSEDNGETYIDMTATEDNNYNPDDGSFKIKISQNGYYKMRVTDNVGNKYITDTIIVKNIDKNAPEINSLTVRATHKDHENDDIEWKAKYATVDAIVNDKGTSCIEKIYWEIKDEDGNIKETYSGFRQFADNLTGDNIKISFKLDDLEKLNNGKYQICAWVTDNGGNKSQEVCTDLYVDKKAPVLSWNNTAGSIINGVKWYGKSDLKNGLKVSVIASDLDSGINKSNISVKVNNVILNSSDYKVTGNKYNKNIIIKSVNGITWDKCEGHYNIEVNVTDNTLDYDNNTKSINTEFSIDNTNPVISSFNMKISGNEGNIDGDGNVVNNNKYGYYFKKASKLDIYGKDDDDNNNSAGVKSISYFLCKKGEKYDVAKKEKITKITDKDNKITIDIPEGFKGQIYAIATDMLGNSSDSFVKPSAIVVDNNNDTDSVKISRPVTEFKDNAGRDLYNDNTTVRIEVKDITSGIREVGWKVESDNDKSANYNGLLSVNNEGELSGEISDVVIIETEENLRTKLSKDILVSNNDNNIRVTVTVIDRAGNISTDTDVFSIDRTPPVVTVAYDNNSPDSVNTQYFNRDRTATITIRERNFNLSDVNVQITNTDGNIPDLSDWNVVNGTGNGDDTLYFTTIKYKYDGDYTFLITYNDNAGNQSVKSFARETVSADRFIIDKTSPKMNVSYNNNDAVNGNYYQDNRIVTFTINEHNFDPERFELIVTENGALISKRLSWSGDDDIHMASVSLDNEALYNIYANYRDMAGNNITKQYITEFYVDKSIPELILSGVEDRTTYTDKVVSFNISSVDTYFEDVKMTLSLIKSDGTESDIIKNNVRKTNDVEIITGNIYNGRQLTVSNLMSDGIYKLLYSASDKSGRVLEKSILFSVNREGPTYFIDDEITLTIKDKYLKVPQDIVFNEINVNELVSDTIRVTVFRGNNNRELEEGRDYTVEKSESEDAWCEYRYIIKKENFTENGIYRISITSKDMADNDSVSEKFSFIVDNEAPVCNVFGLKNNEVYVSDNRSVKFKLTDNIKLDSVNVYINNKEILVLEGDELIKALGDDNIISFVINSSNLSQNLRIDYKDMAGNEGQIKVNNFYVTKNLWIRFITNTPLVTGTVIIMLLLISLLIIMLIRKRCNRKYNN